MNDETKRKPNSNEDSQQNDHLLKSGNDFPGEQRIHIGLAVRDVASSIAFYEVLLGAGPSKIRPGYAKFEPDDPSVNLSLIESRNRSMNSGNGHQANHFGVQVKTSQAVMNAMQRFQVAGIPFESQKSTSCCYAVQQKVWVTDPEGHEWEIFVVLDPDGNQLQDSETRCCEESCCADEN